jgi:CPA2 family monovalent cation:H+ antiporter-2
MAALHAMNVAEVVQPELEASLEMTRQALLHLRMPALDILQLTDRLRETGYGPVSERRGDDHPTLRRLAGATRLLDLRWVRIVEGSPMAGRTIGELAVRTATGASIAAQLRHEAFVTSPGPEARLETGDLVAIVGDRAQIDRFEQAVSPPTPRA